MQKRVLYYSEGWGFGGIETFVMNTVRCLNSQVFGFDIFCTHDWNESHDTEIAKLGGCRYVVFKGHKPGLRTRFKASTKKWRSLLREHHYDIVHINTMNGMGFAYAHIAEQEGVPVRIVHSHNTAFGSGLKLVKQIAHTAGKTVWGKSATTCLACSSEAGEYLFGKGDFQVVRNGVDIDMLRFNHEVREAYRAELGIENDTVLFGAPGRLSEAKNPLFQVGILKHLLDGGVRAKLLLVGEGPLKERIEVYASQLGIDNALIIRSATDNVAPYYWALDVFTMPSTFEGAPTTPIEAAVAGLPFICSDNVPSFGAHISGEYRLGLNDANEWAEKVVDIACLDSDFANRRQSADKFAKLGFSYKATAKMVEGIYKDSLRLC
ncbi:glycosyltransferase [Bifidobacterium panos]|nr:glycosyltransferase [Bifidobacterium sp. DSM 109963]